MALRTVDLVALGPPPHDPYEPSATAWALAGAFAARGDSVRVLHPEGPAGAPAPAGIESVAVPLRLRRPGAAVDSAEFAGAAGRRVRRDAQLVVRDPLGVGALHPPGGRAGPPIVAFVRSVELVEFDREHSASGSSGFAARLDRWRDRRSLRRLEHEALSEADVLFTDRPDLARTATGEYAIPERRWRASVPPVPDLRRPDSRTAARTTLGIPPDVLAVATPTPEAPGGAGVVDRAREAFRRVRPFFPGVRLIVAGATAPVEPGVVALPTRDGATFALGLTAANVALFPGGGPPFDPMVVEAMRAECAVAAAPSVRLPIDPDGAVRYAASDDPGDVASTLAELLADPALCREAVARGARHAASYAPEKVVAAIDAALPDRGR